jgi:hypothetical protein
MEVGSVKDPVSIYIKIGPCREGTKHADGVRTMFDAAGVVYKTVSNDNGHFFLIEDGFHAVALLGAMVVGLLPPEELQVNVTASAVSH